MGGNVSTHVLMWIRLADGREARVSLFERVRVVSVFILFTATPVRAGRLLLKTLRNPVFEKHLDSQQEHLRSTGFMVWLGPESSGMRKRDEGCRKVESMSMF